MKTVWDEKQLVGEEVRTKFAFCLTKINEAIKTYNSLNRRRELREKLVFESGLVALHSLAELKELEQITDLYED